MFGDRAVAIVGNAMNDDAGRLGAGMRADLAVWDVESPAELSYRIGFNPLWKRIFGGRP